MASYEQMLTQAERMRNNFKDLVDQPNDGSARSVFSEIEGLVSDLKAKKSGMTIDNRLKNLEQRLKHLNEEVMDFRHSNMLADTCNDMRRDTRNL
jgi:hypothetical protein